MCSKSSPSFPIPRIGDERGLVLALGPASGMQLLGSTEVGSGLRPETVTRILAWRYQAQRLTMCGSEAESPEVVYAL